MDTKYTIRVLVRANKILECFTLTNPERSLMDIVRETGLNKSTVYRMLETLESLRWVKWDPKTGLYRLGLGIFEIGNRAIQGLDFYQVSRPYLEKLVEFGGQSAHLATKDDDDALYLNKLENPNVFIAQPSSIGRRLPMHCTACGKILLAYLEESEVEEIINRKGLPKFTPNTITTKEKLFAELRVVREKGYAVDNEEIQGGLRCVAAPIRDASGKVVAAVSVSGLKSVFADEFIPQLAEEVVKNAEAISRELGYKGD